ncbi:hypothetical protein SAMN02745866_00340 [Alteromonadaceae bacterium Bs31]|nr:hypothetical protein SAMN02745866_00340 [Alteromonadaceae bacterium Bs31]
MMVSETLVAALLLGLMGAGHCIGMCGGLAAGLAFANGGKSAFFRFGILLSYNIGRVFSYALIGALFAFVFGGVDQLSPLPVLRLISGILLIGMGLYLADWWRGLTRLEALGGHVWKYLAPLGKKLMPVTRLDTALLLGAIWGWLPCGLVYSVLALAAVQTDPVSGAMVMAAFGLGTLPAILFGGLASAWVKRYLQNKILRVGFGIVFIAYGVYTLAPVVTMFLIALGVMEPASDHSMHHHH